MESQTISESVATASGESSQSQPTGATRLEDGSIDYGKGIIGPSAEDAAQVNNLKYKDVEKSFFEKQREEWGKKLAKSKSGRALVGAALLVGSVAGRPQVWDDLATIAKPFIGSSTEMVGEPVVDKMPIKLDFETPPPDKEEEQAPVSTSTTIEASPPPSNTV